MGATAFADGHLFGVDGQGDGVRVNQGVVKNDIGAVEQTGRTQGDEIGGTGPGADQVDRSGHCAKPALPRRLR